MGDGLHDDRYVVETFRSLANGDIVPVQADRTARKGPRRARGRVLTLKAVEKLRPARDQIIIATGVRRRDCGVQLWGWRSLGIFAERRQRGLSGARGWTSGRPVRVANRSILTPIRSAGQASCAWIGISTGRSVCSPP